MNLFSLCWRSSAPGWGTSRHKLNVPSASWPSAPPCPMPKMWPTGWAVAPQLHSISTPMWDLCLLSCTSRSVRINCLPFSWRCFLTDAWLVLTLLHVGLQRESHSDSPAVHGQTSVPRHHEALSLQTSCCVRAVTPSDTTHGHRHPHLLCCWCGSSEVSHYTGMECN